MPQATPKHTPWLICADSGGTFTDCFARSPEGEVSRFKVLSNSSLRGRIAVFRDPFHLSLDIDYDLPENFFAGFQLRLLCAADDAGVLITASQGGELALAAPLDARLFIEEAVEMLSPEPSPLLAARIATRTLLGTKLPPTEFRVATTRGTNALLVRDLAKVAFFTTEGFEDILEIGDGTRKELFALAPAKRRPALTNLAFGIPERMDAQGRAIYALDADELRSQAFHAKEEAEVAAVSFINAWKNPEHEAIAAAVLREMGFENVIEGSVETSGIGFLRRSEHAVVEAALTPVVGGYLQEIKAALCEDSSLLAMTSAGGLTPVGEYRATQSLLSGPAGGAAGVAAIARAFDEAAVLGLDMGGTSADVVRWAGDFEFRYQTEVGAGRVATPSIAIETVAAGGGSVCWWDGHRLRVGPHSAGANPGPACYGAGGPLTLTDVNLLLGRIAIEDFEIPVAIEAAEKAIADLLKQMGAESDQRQSMLIGLLEIANERMAETIRQVSMRKGHDPKDHALIAFGGAGGLHVCEIAELLGVDRVIFPQDAGLLSALGLIGASEERQLDFPVMMPLIECLDALEPTMLDLRDGAISHFASPKEPDHYRTRRIARMRIMGQDESLDIDAENPSALASAFAETWQARFGYAPPEAEIEVVALRVIVREQREFSLPDAPSNTLKHAAFHLPDHWQSEAGPRGLVATPKQGVATTQASQSLAVERSLFANRFTAIAEDMGETLRLSSLSTNIRERLDFSCALLNASGEMLVNAPHIPVHLGALGLCVRLATEACPLAEGQTLLTNHPAFGGSHLPDLTLVSAVHHEGEVLGYVASRAHHAEIGGITPGSMPPDASKLSEEGAVIAPQVIAQGSELNEDLVLDLFMSGPHPSRQPQDNLADIRAALNANQRGVAELKAMAEKYGSEKVKSQMTLLADHAEAEMRATLAAMPDGTRDAMELLDDGTMLCVEMMIEGEHARIDFTGTSGVHAGNLNATPAIVNSALIYALRLLIGKELPLNEGMLRPIEVEIPAGILNPDFSSDDPPAIVGGNVETSQRLVDTLLKALGIAAASQGTMNNLLFGNQGFSYYETIPGGAGATAERDGVSGVQIHMTNTRISDIEVMEQRYPLRLERFSLRDGSGGIGQYSGGDGVIREILFLEGVTLSFMGEHRKVAPFGVKGGADGDCGRQEVVRPGGRVEEVPGRATVELQAGDRFVVETPGGGGFGAGE